MFNFKYLEFLNKIKSAFVFFF